jgi:ABC-2 type transport system permease protein
VQIILDGSDSNTATLALGYAQSILSNYSVEIRKNQLLKTGAVSIPQQIPQPLNILPRVWYNEDLDSHNNIIPGLIAVIMMVIAALLTSLTIAREWEQGTMEQLIATPVKAPELIIGKMIPYFLIGLLDVFLAFLMGEFVFQVPFRGNILFLQAMAAIFMVGALSLGIVISIYARTQLLASQLAMVLTLMPSFLLSGFFASIANMPYIIQLVTYLVPARYFITILRGIYLKGIGIEVLYIEVILLAIFGISMFLIANLKFKKKIG